MNDTHETKSSVIIRFLRLVETAGNKLPDPAILFFYALLAVWVCSWGLSYVHFDLINPRTNQPIVVNNLLTPIQIVDFLASMTTTFITFAPLGIVLVAILGIGVAEQSGFVGTSLRKLLGMAPRRFLTPMLILVAIACHVASDADVLVLPLGALVFHAAGRHPLAGLAAAFAGITGAFSANFVPVGTDALLQSFTQAAARLHDPNYTVNVLCNYFFTFTSAFLIIALGWLITDKVVEPYLQTSAPLNEGLEPSKGIGPCSARDNRAFRWATFVLLGCLTLLFLAMLPASSPLRAPDGSLSSHDAPVVQALMPLIFFLFVLPGTVYGFLSGAFQSGKDVINAMTANLRQLSSFLVMAFFCSLFIKAFGDSNLGSLLALSGATMLRALDLPSEATIIGLILLTAVINLIMGSASAKWAFLSPILVPMLMAVGISPELTQAAYRVGDSSTNTITPLLTFFPIVVVFCQVYVRKVGIGTVVSMMMPYSVTFLICWTALLLLYWALGLPLGVQAPYVYPPP